MTDSTDKELSLKARAIAEAYIAFENRTDTEEAELEELRKAAKAELLAIRTTA